MSASQQRLRADQQGTMSVRGDSGQCAAFTSPSVAHASPNCGCTARVTHTQREQPSELLCELHCPRKWVLDQTRRLGIISTVILDSGVVCLAAGVRVLGRESISHLACGRSSVCDRGPLRAGVLPAIPTFALLVPSCTVRNLQRTVADRRNLRGDRRDSGTDVVRWCTADERCESVHLRRLDVCLCV